MSTTPPTTANRKQPLYSRYRWLVTIIILGLLCLVLIPQTDALWRSLAALAQAAVLPTIVAIAMTGLTYVLAAEVYHLLLKHPIRLRRVLLVQAATALTSRVAPIGVGTMGLNALFLRKQGHSLAQSLAVVAVNNGLGVTGHLLLLAVVATTAPLPDSFDFSPSQATVYWIALAVAVVSLTLVLLPRLRLRLHQALRSLWRDIASYRHSKRMLVSALGVNIMLSLVYVLALAASAEALGAALAFNQLFMVYTFSILVGVATPTPGGIVGVEAGLAGGFIAYGVPADTALAIALLYRLITYWLPLIPGFIAFRIVQHRYL